MNQHPTSPFGELMEPTTLRIQRLLPGPIERVWAYLTESGLRAQWLAAGEMAPTVGAPFELVWRNDNLTDPPGERPEGFGAEHRMQSRILEIEPPRRLTFTFEGSGDVTIALEPQGDEVLLTLIHRRLPNRGMMLGVSSGWHAHLDVLAARARGENPAPFWDEVRRLREDYERRLPA
ncbi:MAG TPA: SRPBCC family protein [Allosphingosinicella sp.]|jgi:uncharacterized protein YndB with AHSA1/START domain|nr:SRPBCC family protein [Allosphingosinicella sp.]